MTVKWHVVLCGKGTWQHSHVLTKRVENPFASPAKYYWMIFAIWLSVFVASAALQRCLFVAAGKKHFTCVLLRVFANLIGTVYNVTTLNGKKDKVLVICSDQSSSRFSTTLAYRLRANPCKSAFSKFLLGEAQFFMVRSLAIQLFYQKNGALISTQDE